MFDLKRIIDDSDLADHIKYYWGYQFDLGRISAVPYLKNHNVFKAGFNVAEIGSAEGGVLGALLLDGAAYGLGTDIAKNRLEWGKKIADIGNLNIDFIEHNIITEEPKEEWIEKFDLVILRDVIEHLSDPIGALKNIRRIVKKGGCLWVTFPPYHSAFGGHQHTTVGTFSMIPFIHLLPKKIFYKLLYDGRADDLREVESIRNIKLTTKKFEDAANISGFKIHHSDYYLLRPVFKMKFGLPTLKLTPIKDLPLIKKFIALEASYLLINEK
jgi:SAM-dependent methyltransferase